MNKGDLAFRNPTGKEFAFDVLIDAVCKSLLRIALRFRLFCGHSLLSFWDTHVNEHQLRRFVIGFVLPDTMNAANALVDFAVRIVRSARTYQPDVERRFPSIGADCQHVVFISLHLARPDSLCPVNDRLHVRLCRVRRGDRMVDVLMFRDGQIGKVFSRLHVSDLPVHLHHFGDILKPAKPCPWTIPAFRGLFQLRHCAAKRGSP